ncbi:AlkA N-terminal domain-containing protein, partial [Micromonospora aurantiaca (nom. illeg.)]|uniref:AlkA N-terminal domain-containing protein n=1 Tax=Micromonospora aurantiaca (nom. illeg.) TaxID=47850 RepID=UPI00381E2925
MSTTHVDPPGGHGRPAVPFSATEALARCVAVEPAKFAADHWGRSPLLSRAAELPNPDGFTDLLSPADADELLSRRGLRTPFLRVAKDGQLVPAARFTGGGGAGAEIGDQVLDEKVLALYADGATLVLQGLHRTWPAIVDFARDLGTALAQPLQVNAYLTPAGSQGFATHYDTHDVFVLQVDGRKHWRIHPPVLADPLERQPWGGRADEVSATAEGRPELDVVLEPGDALYLPRGWLHSAQAQESSSLHLTVGIRALTRYAVVEELLALAAEDARLRASLPFGLDLAVQALKNELRREVYGGTPSELRAGRRGPAATTGAGTLSLRLAYRPPLHAGALLDFLALRALPGVEVVRDGTYHRGLRLPHGPATVALAPADGHIDATLRLADMRDLAPAVARCRRLLDLDADPVAVDATLAADPALAP